MCFPLLTVFFTNQVIYSAFVYLLDKETTVIFSVIFLQVRHIITFNATHTLCWISILMVMPMHLMIRYLKNGPAAYDACLNKLTILLEFWCRIWGHGLYTRLYSILAVSIYIIQLTGFIDMSHSLQRLSCKASSMSTHWVAAGLSVSSALLLSSSCSTTCKHTTNNLDWSINPSINPSICLSF